MRTVKQLLNSHEISRMQIIEFRNVNDPCNRRGTLELGLYIEAEPERYAPIDNEVLNSNVAYYFAERETGNLIVMVDYLHKETSIEKKYLVKCIETEKTYESIKECATAMHLKEYNISKCLTGRMKKTMNYSFKYEEA